MLSTRVKGILITASGSEELQQKIGDVLYCSTFTEVLEKYKHYKKLQIKAANGLLTALSKNKALLSEYLGDDFDSLQKELEMIILGTTIAEQQWTSKEVEGI